MSHRIHTCLESKFTKNSDFFEEITKNFILAKHQQGTKINFEYNKFNYQSGFSDSFPFQNVNLL